MTGPVSRLREALRQRRHHRAFRIPPAWDVAQRARLEQLIASLAAADDEVRQAGEPAFELGERALADAATNLWRAQRRLEQEHGRPSAEARQAGRYLRNSHDALREAGLVVQDHDGDAFHPGLSLEVLVFEDDPALATEVVLETVKPSIYLRDHRIQMGVVIVGRPAGRKNTGEDTHA